MSLKNELYVQQQEPLYHNIKAKSRRRPTVKTNVNKRFKLISTRISFTISNFRFILKLRIVKVFDDPLQLFWNNDAPLNYAAKLFSSGWLRPSKFKDEKPAGQIEMIFRRVYFTARKARGPLVSIKNGSPSMSE